MMPVLVWAMSLHVYELVRRVPHWDQASPRDGYSVDLEPVTNFCSFGHSDRSRSFDLKSQPRGGDPLEIGCVRKKSEYLGMVLRKHLLSH